MKKGIIIAACGGIIAGLFLEFHSTVFSFISEAMTFLILMASWIWESITSNYSVSGWLILIAGLLSIFGLTCVCILIYIAFQSKTEPEFLKYKEDYFYGANWRWTWDRNKISNLWCFCPVCDAQLVPSESIDKTQFICEQCSPDRSDNPYEPQWKIVTTIRGGDRYYATSAVEREILRRIRTKTHPV